MQDQIALVDLYSDAKFVLFIDIYLDFNVFENMMGHGIGPLIGFKCWI